MQDTIAEAVARYRYEKKRQEVAALCVSKLNDVGKFIPYVRPEVLDLNNYKLAIVSWTVLSITLCRLAFKRLLFRIPSTVGLIIYFSINANRHQVANIIEEVAEYPTDYGQTVRAVFIFKYNEGPKTQHYEHLSEQYRKYLKKKSISS